MALEYQRYGRNKETLINKTYIESGDYKRKFDNITDNPSLNKTLYEKSKEALKHRSGTLFEDMYWIDGESGKIVAEIVDSTLEQGIDYTANIKRMLKSCENREIVTLHTHPSSMPPSVADFNSCVKNGYKEGYIACHNGKIFRYSSEEIISDKLFDLYFNEKLIYNTSECDAQIETIKEIMRNKKIKFDEVKQK